MKLVFCEDNTIPRELSDKYFYINCGYIYHRPNVIEFYPETWFRQWEYTFPANGFMKFTKPLSDNAIVDFISTLIIQQPEMIYINDSREEVWDTPGGKKLISMLKEICK